MMHGRPIVSHTGIPDWPQAQFELLDDWQHYIVQSDDVIEYADLMFWLMNNPEAMCNYSNWAENKAKNKYHYLEVCKEYIRFFEKCIK